MAPVPELTAPLWERQPNETPAAYNAFRIYRDLGPKIGKNKGRTIQKAGEVYASTFGTALKTSQSRLQQWGQLWRWKERAQAYDNHLGTFFDAAREDQAEKDAVMMAGREQAIRDREADMADAAYHKVMQALQDPSTKADRVIQVAPQLLKEVSRLDRMSAEMPTEGARVPQPVVDTSATSDVEAYLEDHLTGKGSPKGLPEDSDSPD